MSERPKGKSIGRRAPAKAAVAAVAEKRAKAGRAAPAVKPAAGKKSTGAAAKSKPTAAAVEINLRPSEQALLDALAARTRLSASEVVARALQSYAAAVAPELRSAPPREEVHSGDERLFLSVDGRPEIEVSREEFVLGSAEGTDLRLDLPLIGGRHARILRRDGRYLFEDLGTGKGSYRQGALVDVRFLEDGDEIDLGGFLPIRFRLERSSAA